MMLCLNHLLWLGQESRLQVQTRSLAEALPGAGLLIQGQRMQALFVNRFRVARAEGEAGVKVA